MLPVLQAWFRKLTFQRRRERAVCKGLWSLPVVFLFATASVIIYFSAISYVGLGVPPGVPNWDNAVK